MQKRHQFIRPSVLLCILTLLPAAAQAQWAPMNPVTAVQRQPDGVLFTMKTGTLKLQVCTRFHYSCALLPDCNVLRSSRLRRDQDQLARDQMGDAIHR